MAQDPEVLRNYLDAVRALDEASRSGDRNAFVAAEVTFADAAEAYADDHDRNGYMVPHGLREQIAMIRARS